MDWLSRFWGGIGNYVRDPLAWLSALGTGLGVYDMYRQRRAEEEFMRRQRDWMRRVEAVANAPLNVAAIFNPAKQLIQRDIEAGLAERGLQPGGAWASAIGEGMMRHWLTAADIARAQRANQIAAMTGAAPARPQYSSMGDVSALGKYLQYQRESKAAEEARKAQAARDERQQQILLEAIRSRQPAVPTPGGGGGSSIDIYRDLNPYEGYEG